MKILHTSDWHLGKSLDGCSRLEEQQAFADELVDIAEAEQVNMVLVAGDVFDSVNPPAAAEKLLFDTCLRLSDGMKRPVILIAGNHDSPERLTAANALASRQGIFLCGKLQDIIPTGKYDGFDVVDSGEGYVELVLENQRVVLLMLPYPSEKRLNEFIYSSIEEREMAQKYEEKIAMLFETLSAHFQKDSINIIMSHFFMMGGSEAGSERPIQLGGSYAVSSSVFPAHTDYIAMGHLHRPQKLPGIEKGYYSGSPIQYSKAEAGHAKSVYIAELSPGGLPVVKQLYLKNYKPIEIWEAKSVADALSLCEKRAGEHSYVYLEVHTGQLIEAEDIRKMKALKEDILEILPILPEFERSIEEERIEEKSLKEQFIAFYKSKYEVEPDIELVDLFLNIAGEEETDEAADAQD